MTQMLLIGTDFYRCICAHFLFKRIICVYLSYLCYPWFQEFII